MTASLIIKSERTDQWYTAGLKICEKEFGGKRWTREGVKYGFFGDVEVISKTAFSILVANIDACDKDTLKE